MITIKFFSRWWMVVCVAALFALNTAPALAQPIAQAAAPKVPVPITEVEFKGMLSAMEGVSPNLMLKVSGYLVATDKWTLIQGQLMIGASVQVSGFLRPDGLVSASKIVVEDNTKRIVRFRAPIVSLPDDANWHGEWQVGKYTIVVKDTTTIDTRAGKPQIGALAQVIAIRQSDGSLLASYIVIEGNPGSVTR